MEVSDAPHRLKHGRDSNGYAIVRIKDAAGRKKTVRVHRLILEAFRGPCPPGMEARHLDNDPGNPALTNLEWSTPSVNNLDKRKFGTHGGEAAPAAKHSLETVRTIREMHVRDGIPPRQIASYLGLKLSMVYTIVCNQRWMRTA